MVTALLLSGGTGMRMGVETPKQYIEVNGKPIIAYGLQTLLSHEGIDAVQIVADAMWRETILNCMEHLRSGGHDSISPEKKDRGIEKFRGFSAPGKTRQLSILNGLEDIGRYAADADYVLIHDAARPLVSAAMLTECLAAAAEHEGALPVLPMKEIGRAHV